ncbi:hypothetical protein OF83DRAFT_1263303 [Amylostereum chailletii]|nr:hypothetical protein OF83DRAFT_1263303 [Amylostereum chailletii]
MVSSSIFIAALLALASLSEASSHRPSRHNGRNIARAVRRDGSSRKCRSHPPSLPANATSSAVASTTPVATSVRVSAATNLASVASSASASSSSSSAKKASSTAASTSAPKASSSSSSSSSSTSSLTGLLKALFPVTQSSDAWTTVDGADDALPLTDSTLKIQSNLKALAHPYVQTPGADSRLAMRAHFDAGAWGLNKGVLGGMSWYGQGATEDWSNAKEMTFGYSILFDHDFAFNKGGKLPGLYFGQNAEDAQSCSGGSRRTDCASVRLMWRTDGKGEFYTYLPNPDVSPAFSANKKLCDVAPQSECNDEFGASVGRGAFAFTPGRWTTLSMRVLLNDAGQANGQIELFVDGQSTIAVDGLIIAHSDSDTPTRAQGIMAQTFFGGSDDSWASPRDQNIYFSDFSASVTKHF